MMATRRTFLSGVLAVGLIIAANQALDVATAPDDVEEEEPPP